MLLFIHSTANRKLVAVSKKYFRLPSLSIVLLLSLCLSLWCAYIFLVFAKYIPFFFTTFVCILIFIAFVPFRSVLGCVCVFCRTLHHTQHTQRNFSVSLHPLEKASRHFSLRMAWYACALISYSLGRFAFGFFCSHFPFFAIYQRDCVLQKFSFTAVPLRSTIIKM